MNLKKGFGISLVALALGFGILCNASANIKTPHEGVCILNRTAPLDAHFRSQFFCYVEQKIVSYRCDLNDEGGNVQIGVLGKDGFISFLASENFGNQPYLRCQAAL